MYYMFNEGFSRYDVIDTLRARQDRIGDIARATKDSDFKIVERPYNGGFFAIFNDLNGETFACDVEYSEISIRLKSIGLD